MRIHLILILLPYLASCLILILLILNCLNHQLLLYLPKLLFALNLDLILILIVLRFLLIL